MGRTAAVPPDRRAAADLPLLRWVRRLAAPVIGVVGRLEDWAIIVFMAALLAAVDVQIFFRYVLNDSLIWPEEVARILLVWISFIGAAAVSRQGGHLCIDTLVDLFPGPMRLAVLTLADAVVVGLLAVLIRETLASIDALSSIRTAALELPITLLFAPLVLGGVLMAIHIVARAAGRFTGEPEAERGPGPLL